MSTLSELRLWAPTGAAFLSKRRIMITLLVFAFGPGWPGASSAREIVFESEYQVLLKQGENNFRIEASDVRGNEEIVVRRLIYQP